MLGADFLHIFNRPAGLDAHLGDGGIQLVEARKHRGKPHHLAGDLFDLLFDLRQAAFQAGHAPLERVDDRFVLATVVLQEIDALL